ncbi:MAG TPA: hypothetical protein VLJ88_04190 [Propionibacteriaceae bacterium]|nr:hypothetical protein [Propionibacteriaceae bacterium]
MIVLLDGATVPSADQLPAELRPLIDCEALDLAEATFTADAARLIDLLGRLVERPEAAPVPAEPTESELMLDENVQFTVYRPRAIRPAGPAAPGDVFYFEYADQSALSAAFVALTPGDYQAGDCQAADQELEYTTDEAPGDRVGRLRCYQIQGVASLAWTHNELNVMAVAQDSTMTFPGLRSWWSTAGPYLTRPASRARGRSDAGRDEKGLAAACSGVQVAARHQRDRCPAPDHYSGPL